MRASERAFDVMRDEILTGALAPGTPIRELETADRLGVSRIPLREALARLAQIGLVESVGRSTHVTRLTRRRVVALLELREGLAVELARLAAGRRDPEAFRPFVDDLAADAAHETPEGALRLDRAIADAADSRYLAKGLEDVHLQMHRLLQLVAADTERARLAIEERRTIARAILHGDEELAMRAVRFHLHRTRALILAAVPDDPA